MRANVVPPHRVTALSHDADIDDLASHLTAWPTMARMGQKHGDEDGAPDLSVVAKKSLDDEFEADLFGAMFTELALSKEGYSYPLTVFGINLCLIAIGIIEGIDYLKKSRDTSHLSFLLRRRNLEKFTVRGDHDFFTSIDAIFRLLLQDFDTFCERVLNQIISNEEKINAIQLKEYIENNL